jgi:hypothetical protein
MEAMFNSQANLVVLNILLMRWVGKTSGIGSSLRIRCNQFFLSEGEKIMTKWPKREEIENVLKSLEEDSELYSLPNFLKGYRPIS